MSDRRYDRSSADHTKAARVIRRALLLLVSWLLADGVLYFGLRQLDSSRIFYDRSAVSPHRLDYWLRSSYDAELGWDIPAASKNTLGASRRGDYPALAQYRFKAFGDSFTFGSDVSDHEMWPALIEQQGATFCLNYGVPGYGPDQAVLKYERTPVQTDFTILGIAEENIARVVNIYRAFYMEDWGPPKPRFFLDGSGLRLEPNPIPRPEDARRLLDPAFVDALRRLDYWPHYNEEVLGAPRRLAWPATRTVLTHAPFFARRAALELRLRFRPTFDDELRRFRYCHLYSDSSEAFLILSRVIDRFVDSCRRRGEQPLVLIFPMEHSVEVMNRYHRSIYEPLARRLNGRSIPHIDFGPVFAHENFSAYYGHSGHLSAAGNERVAREILHYAARLEKR